MSRTSLLKWVIIALLAVMVSDAAEAQDKIPLEFGQRVSGELTNDQYETKYTFSGKQGQLVMAVMMADLDGDSVDAFLVLRTSDGDILGQNDDVIDGYSLVIVELPADGDYTLLATRYNGKDGDTQGKYWIEVDDVQPLTPGSKMSMSIASADEKRFPSFYVLAPDTSTSVKLGFNLVSGGQYPQISLFRWVDDNYPDSLIQAFYMNNISSLAFSANLEPNEYYVLMFDPIPIFYGNDATASLAFTVS